MARLTEPYIEANSIEFLKNYYASLYSTKVYSKSQAITVNKGKADGYLCFHSNKQPFHSVSIEAKSHKTLANLKPYFVIMNFIDHILILSLFLAIIPTFYFNHLVWYWLILLYLLFFSSIFLLLGWIFNHSQPSFYKKVDVVNQVNRYPANEKWVTMSSDSVKLLKERKAYIKGCSYENLLSICKRMGIGLLVVNRVSSNIILHPTFRKGKFWTQYTQKERVEIFFQNN